MVWFAPAANFDHFWHTSEEGDLLVFDIDVLNIFLLQITEITACPMHEMADFRPTTL